MLLSIGRRAFTADLGLETIGVYTERGAIVTDSICAPTSPASMPPATSTDKSMLAHTAYRESEVAVSPFWAKKDRMRYNAIPAVIYTNPEVACVGEIEESAKAKGMDVQVANVTMKFSGRYVARWTTATASASSLWIKVQPAGGLPHDRQLLLRDDLRAGMMIEDRDAHRRHQSVFPHPTVCREVIREALFEEL